MNQPSESTEEMKAALNMLVQVELHWIAYSQADETFAQQRVRQLESELQRLRENLASSSALASEIATLQDAKRSLESRVETLEREQDVHVSQLSKAVNAFELIENELRARIDEVKMLKGTLERDQTLLAKMEVVFVSR